MFPPVCDDARMALRAVPEDLLESIAEEVQPALVEFAFVCDDQMTVWPTHGGDRRFHIGSITKPFTALVLADMVEAGEVSLAHAIGTYLPEARACADVTLHELATHTSGLPQLPDPLPARGAQCPHDPYSAVTSADMLEAAVGASPGPQRGEFEYSNFGYALLGVVLSAAAGATFENLLRSRVLNPLGLHDTTLAVEGDERLVDGHDLNGASVPHWHNLAMAGCGGLLSTSADLARFLTAQLDPDATPLASAIKASHRPLLQPGDRQYTALGWAIDDLETGPRYWHNGGTAGFSAYAAFDPTAATGVGVVLSRTPSRDGSLERLGNRLLAGLASQ